jgi:hypothetical protein
VPFESITYVAHDTVRVQPRPAHGKSETAHIAGRRNRS